MHIPNGFIDPKMAGGLLGAAVAALAFCVAKVRAMVTALVPERALAAAGKGLSTMANRTRRALTQFGEQKLYLMGMVASLVFAAQMFNFPIASGTSGHLLGGVLAVVLLGPYAGAIVIAVVLGVQALFFADGGLLAWGANVINMSFIGGFLCYYLYAGLRKIVPEWLSIAIASWVSVVAASFACSLEVGWSGTIALSSVIPAMFIVHALIGIAEAAITLLLVQVFRKMVPQVETGEESTEG